MLFKVISCVDCSSLPVYLGIWSKLLSNNDEDLLIKVVNFLLSNGVTHETDVKSILVHLTDFHTSKIISQIVDHLRFSSWFYSVSFYFDKDFSDIKIDTSEKQSLNNLSSPKSFKQNLHTDRRRSFNFSQFKDFRENNDCLLMTLTDLMNSSTNGEKNSKEISKYFHIILVYALLFYDSSVPLYHDLLFTIILRLKRNQSSELELEDNTWQAHLKLLLNGLGNQFKESLAQETILWACGCGNLTISSRALLMLIEIGIPLTKQQWESLILSIVHVTNLNQSPNATEYITNAIKLLSNCLKINAISNKDEDDDEEEEKVRWELAIIVSKPFLNIEID